MVYVFLAEGFEEIEALTPVDILRRAGLTVATVGVGVSAGRPEITGSHGIVVKADITLKDVEKEAIEAIVLPGGMPGTMNLDKSPRVQEIIDYCTAEKIWIGAICAAPSILGRKGLLRGKEATAFPKFQEALAGATLSKDYVCQDGTLITAGAWVSPPSFPLNW